MVIYLVHWGLQNKEKQPFTPHILAKLKSVGTGFHMII